MVFFLGEGICLTLAAFAPARHYQIDILPEPAGPRRVSCNHGGTVARPRAADDFYATHQRIKELRREAAAPPPAPPCLPPPRDIAPADNERRLRERREGVPPPWLRRSSSNAPSNRQIACRF
jgi:hypothetical protein